MGSHSARRDRAGHLRLVDSASQTPIAPPTVPELIELARDAERQDRRAEARAIYARASAPCSVARANARS